MGNGGIKSIIVAALLVVLSFIIGVQASDGAVNAMAIIAVIVGLFIMLYLGKNAWWMIFLAPPLISAVPIGALHRFPIPLMAGAGVLLYWLVMRAIGQVHFTWRSLWSFDAMMLIISIYTCISFYRNPAIMAFLEVDYDTIGGQEYFFWLLAVFYFIAVSSIPIRYEQMIKVYKYAFFLTLGVSVWGILRGGGSAAASDTDLMENAQTTRFTMFTGLGVILFHYLYLRYPLRNILISPFKIITMLLCVGSVLISGWRGSLISFSLTTAFVSILKKEFTYLILMGAAVYGSLLFLSSQKALNGLPFGVQRTLAAIPGVHVSRAVERDAHGSSEWRIVMWRWALDPRTKMIKDYVWGDGFGQSREELSRRTTAIMRRTLMVGDQVDFASRGVWHSGWITTMHRLGIIGLVIIVITQFLSVYLTIRMVSGYWKQKDGIFVIYVFISIPSSCIMYHLGTGGPGMFYATLAHYAQLKLVYCLARDKGLIPPLFFAKRYVPMAIQAIEEAPGSSLSGLQPAH